MDIPSDKIIEACARLMSKDIMWITGENEDEPILEENFCHRNSPTWNPLIDSALAFDLMTLTHMRINHDARFKTLYVVANHYPATVHHVYEGLDLKAAYRKAICLTAFHIWNTHHRSITQLDNYHAEAMRIMEGVKNGRG